MRIVQTVFGVFHSFDLARELDRRGYLERIFSTYPWARIRAEGIPRSRVRTFPWIHTPEFLLGRYGLLKPWMADEMGYANALTFDEYTLRRVPECDAIVAISGSSLKTGQLVQQRGGRFVCDRGSSHQKFQEQFVSEEYRRWGLDRRAGDPRDTIREEAIYAACDHITVPSTFALNSFVAMGVPREKLSFIPYGVRLDQFRPVTSPPDDSFQLVFAGGVNLRKGIPYLLQAFAALRHPRKRLRIAGVIAAEIRPVLASLPIENVEFLGHVPQQDLPALFSSSHLFVLPSVEDGFAMVLTQAMACGCPVLASRNSGGPDVVTPGMNGFLTEARDVRAMTAAMQEIADNPELQRRMSQAALRRVTELGGWNSYGDAWEHLLQRLIANRV